MFDNAKPVTPKRAWLLVHIESAFFLTVLIFNMSSSEWLWARGGWQNRFMALSLILGSLIFLVFDVRNVLSRVSVTSVLEAKIFNEQLKSFSAVVNFGATAMFAVGVIAQLQRPTDVFSFSMLYGSLAACLGLNAWARGLLCFLKDEQADTYKPQD